MYKCQGLKTKNLKTNS